MLQLWVRPLWLDSALKMYISKWLIAWKTTDLNHGCFYTCEEEVLGGSFSSPQKLKLQSLLWLWFQHSDRSIFSRHACLQIIHRTTTVCWHSWKSCHPRYDPIHTDTSCIFLMRWTKVNIYIYPYRSYLFIYLSIHLSDSKNSRWAQINQFPFLHTPVVSEW